MPLQRPQDPRQTLEKRFSLPKSDVVRVDGRYRVRKLLGTGGSGRSNSESSLRHFSDLVSECLSRKRHYDGE
jgi:hypothetical protein